MTKSNVFFSICLAFVIGIFVNSIFLQFNSLLEIKGLLYILLFFYTIIFLFKDKKKTFVFSLILTFILGCFLFQIQKHKADTNILLSYDKQEVEIVGIVDQEAQVKEKNNRVILKVSSINGIHPKDTNVIVFLNKDQLYEYGDVLKIKGELTTPPIFESFNYKAYLAKDKIYSQSFNPEVSLLQKNKGNIFVSSIIKLRRSIREKLSMYFNGDKFYLLSSLLIGDKQRIPEDLKDKLKITGMSHMVAISGMHIVMIQEILLFLLLALGLARKKSIFISLLLIVFFIALTGFQISAIRAGIMGSIYIIAKLAERQAMFLKNFLFALTIILISNPLLLRYDIGLQLSFLAVLGIYYISPVISKKLTFIPQFQFLDLRNILAMTISAQIATFPILASSFGKFSLVSFVSNIVIIPILPFLMLVGLLFVFFSYIPVISFLIHIVVLGFISYLSSAINLLSKFEILYIDTPFNMYSAFVFCLIMLYTFFKVYINETKKYFI